jgi:hypothetical protein
MRILLAGAVVFLAVWFTLLRPKSAEVPVTTTTTPPAGNVDTGAPATSAAGKVVEKAKTAATQAEGAAKAAAGETTPDATKTTPGSATTSAPDPKAEALPKVPAATLAKLPKDVAGALESRKVLVLAVLSDEGKRWRPMADDDRYVRNTLKKVNRYDGEVLVKQVPLSGLYSYGPLVNDLKVNQTPSVVVVDRKLKASVIPGYVDRISINQAIADARAASIDPLITDPYLSKANEVCAQGKVPISRWSLPTIPGKKARVASGRRLQAAVRIYRRAVGKLVAPKKWRGLKRQWLAELAGEQKLVDKALTTAKRSDNDIAGWNGVIASWDARSSRKLDRRFNDVGLTSCAVNRQV